MVAPQAREFERKESNVDRILDLFQRGANVNSRCYINCENWEIICT